MAEERREKKENMIVPEQEELPVYRISVRNLVEFLLRSGDIDDRQGTGPDAQAMQLGSALHRKIQRSMGSGYESEVMLRTDIELDGLVIRLEGRADGIMRRPGKADDGREAADIVTIDEIKGIARPTKSLEDAVPVHLAQAKCYACMYAMQEKLDTVRVRMIYEQLYTEEETLRYFYYEYTFSELKAWFDDLIGRYEKWASFELKWRRIRQEAIRETQFPFPWRDGQKKLAKDVYRSILREKVLFIQAPTGVGKTLSTLFPALKAVGEDLADRVFYLTAKTVARTVAAQALDQLRGTGLKCKSIILTAKEKICPCDTVSCNPEDCPYARGHFDRINEAVYALITAGDVFDREGLLKAAEQYRVCPFELSLDVSSWMDVIIADYNYAFHPRAKLKRFFGDGVKGSYLFLVDEAHNLLERGRDMYSAQLVKEDVLALRRAVKDISPKLKRALEKVNRQMLALKRECDTYSILDDAGMLPLYLMNVSGAAQELLDEVKQGRHIPPEVRTQILDLYFQISTFLDVYDRLDDHYIIYDEIMTGGNFMVKLLCVNPAARLQECMDKGRSTLLFSATLLPIDYYRQHLTGQAEHYAVHADSCFDPAHLRVFAATDTSSLYSRRSPAEYARMAAYILSAVRARQGNYMAFFSSYRMLQDVKDAFEDLLLSEDEADRVTVAVQHAGMSEGEREEFLAAFTEDPGKSMVGFCVMGSFFGEGINLPGGRLIGAIIAGTGLPMVCNEQEILRSYYMKNRLDGFRFAYVCPGMNRVLQAAGRVIRTREDRGIVLLLDERFMREEYRRMFPREWQQVIPCRADTALMRMKEFWEE